MLNPRKAEASPAELYGPLLTQVQERAILADGKSFVDAIPRRAVDAILADFERLSGGDDDLRRFIEANFELPVVGEMPTHDGARLPLRDHIRATWRALTREPVTVTGTGSALAIAHRHVVPGGRFREIYYWDSFFTMLGLVRDGQVALAAGMVDSLTDLIERYGHVPNGTRTYYIGRSQPPLYHLMVALLGDERPAVRARRVQAMKAEHSWWMAGADDLAPGEQDMRVARLADGSLLNRYWDPRDTPRDESWGEDVATARATARRPQAVFRDLRAAAESGWDFSSRWLGGTGLETIRTTSLAPVDLNAFLFGLESAIAASGDREAEHYGLYASRRKAAIQRHLWDAAAGHFADYDLERKAISPTLTAAALAPLAMGVATQMQADRTAQMVRDRLLAPGGLRTTLTRSGEQWDAPNGWAPLQWIAVIGLRRYGHAALAGQIARRWIATVDRMFRPTGHLFEKYDVEQPAIGRGGEYAPQIGFGWTNGVTAEFIDQGWGR